MARNNHAASMEKRSLDNGEGDSSTIAAVFSIRHYLIDRVAGLIVHRAIFRVGFVLATADIPSSPCREVGFFLSVLFILQLQVKRGWLWHYC